MRGNPSTSRALNRRLILNLLRHRGALSRAEIATITGLSPAAVTMVVTELMGEALLIESGVQPGVQTGATGRRPVPIDINYAAHLAVGFKLRHDSIDCVLTDLATTPLTSFSMPVADTQPETMVDAIDKAIPALLKAAGRKGEPIMGVGVSIPGEIDAIKGICLQSPRFGWTNLPFPEILRARIHVPVWIDDDIAAFTVAQRLFGAGRQHRDFIALAVGTGIGASLVIGGEIYHGSHGVAGKLGHVVTEKNGRLCECGRRGCLQAHAAEPAMIEQWAAKAGAPTGLRPSDLRDAFLAAVEAGDTIALEIVEEAGLRIGRHLADFVNLFDPEVIIAGGESMHYAEALLAPIRRGMADYLFFTRPDILPDWIAGSWARGAAALATQHLFNFERTEPSSNK